MTLDSEEALGFYEVITLGVPKDIYGRLSMPLVHIAGINLDPLSLYKYAKVYHG